jgi:hypothetical protein
MSASELPDQARLRLEHAGLWVAWSEHFTHIVAAGDSYEAVRDATRRAGPGPSGPSRNGFPRSPSGLSAATHYKSMVRQRAKNWRDIGVRVRPGAGLAWFSSAPYA